MSRQQDCSHVDHNLTDDLSPSKVIQPINIVYTAFIYMIIYGKGFLTGCGLHAWVDI